MSIRTYSIEGNIGSGKSTFLSYLKENYNFNNTSLGLSNCNNIFFLQEPVDQWNLIKDSKETILEKFYKDNKKYAFSFQMMAYISRLSQIMNIIKNNKNKDIIIITERSVYTDKNVFAKMLYDSGNIEEIDYLIYNKWFDNFIDEINISGLIYIKTSANVAFNRVVKRNRKGESIPIEYLEKCNEYHNDWIESCNLKKIIFDGDKENNEELYNNWHTEVNNFIK